MQTSAYFSAKNFGFFEIYGVSVRTRGRGLSQCGHFTEKGGVGSNFRGFVRTSFMDGCLAVCALFVSCLLPTRNCF